MSAWQLVTVIVMITAPCAIIMYDVVAWYFGGQSATITYAVQQIQRRFPETAYLAAALFFFLWMHLFASAFLRNE